MSKYPKDWPERRDAVMERDECTCQRCGKSFEDSRPLDTDHVDTISSGGGHDLENLQALCIGCHGDKHDWDLKDFLPNHLRRATSYVRDHTGVRGDYNVAQQVCRLVHYGTDGYRYPPAQYSARMMEELREVNAL